MSSGDRLLEIDHVTHRYGENVVVRDVSFALARGTIGCLLGPSGCGKTTLLRGIAGFEPVSAGEIRISGVTVSTPNYNLTPERRRVGMVFQDYALFPHLTCARNVGFGLRHLSRADRRRRVAAMLDTVGLSHAASLYPAELSGGQQQRVALARALAPNPELLLLDEPFSNLDVELRERLCSEVRDILKRNNSTAVIVTHDHHEAFAIADEIGIIAGGALQQWSSPYDLYHEPANRFVADFVGQGTLLPGRVLSPIRLEVELGILDGQYDYEPGAAVDVLLRPDDIVHDDDSPRVAEVVAKAFRGADFLYTLRLPSGKTVLSLVPSHHDHPIGSLIGIRLRVDHVIVFPADAVADPA
jgi:iron(III) transport system ATP-binding protein